MLSGCRSMRPERCLPAWGSGNGRMDGRRDSRLFVATRGGRRWIAWLAADRLVELHVQSPEFIDDIGSIHVGRIARLDKNLGAAFVDLGAGRSGLLPLDQVAGKVTEGGRIVVQVARNELSDKGPRLSGHPAISGTYLILTPGRRGVSVSE